MLGAPSEYDLLNVDLEKRDVELRNSSRTQPSSDYVTINIYGSVHAGIPNEAIEDIVGQEDIPKSMLKGGKEFFGLKVSGDSMSPRYLDGDIIIVRKQSTCESGQDCICQVNGDEAVLRKVIIKGDRKTILQAVNPEYEPIIFTGDGDEPPLFILGVVVELRRTML